jgi:hypothetical protein
MKILRRLRVLAVSLFVLVLSSAIFSACQIVGVKLTGISAQDYQTEFALGEEFSVGGLTITAKYSDGTTKTVEDYEIDSSDYNKDLAGEYTIICSYTENGVTENCEYAVNVLEDFSITEIEVEGQNLYFDCGMEFSFGSGVVKKVYSDGIKVVTRDYQIDSSNYDKDRAGEYEIFVICGDNQAVYTVSVMDESYIETVTVTGQRTKYTLGQDFVFNGTVTISYINDRPNDIVPASKYMVNADAYDKNTIGTYQIIVSIGTKNCTFNVRVEEVKSLKILMIGNSYSDDTSWYIPEIAKNFEFDEVEYGVLYIGGCSIQQHYQNSQTGYKGYEFRYYQNGAWTTKYGNDLKSLEYGIKFKDWDFITLQQSSVQSGKVDSYGEALTNLITYVKNTATNPDTQLVWNMTWAYADTYENMQKNGYTNQISMYNLIVNAVQKKIATNANFVAVSPTGTAVQNARTSSLGDTLNRDGTHLTKDVGRYIAAMTMFCTLTGYSVDDITYVPTGVDQSQVAIAKESAKNALVNKYQVTKSQF